MNESELDAAYSILKKKLFADLCKAFRKAGSFVYDVQEYDSSLNDFIDRHVKLELDFQDSQRATK